MNDNIMWGGFWGAVGAVLITLIITCTNVSIQTDQAIVTMVEMGASPMEAGCAVRDGLGDNISCNLIVNSK